MSEQTSEHQSGQQRRQAGALRADYGHRSFGHQRHYGEISVVVDAPDPIYREDVLGQLRRHPEIDVREGSGLEPGTVVVFVQRTLDHIALARLRRVVDDEGARVVLVVSALRDAQLLDVVECGIDVIIWRHEATGDRLVQAVLAAARGDADLPVDLIGRVISQAVRLSRNAAGTPSPPTAGLTPREQDVLRLVAEGCGTGEIAAALTLPVHTVRSVMDGVTTRLRLHNMEHAVAYAIRAGYI